MLSPDNQIFLIIEFAISLFMSNIFIQIPNMLRYKIYIINILARTAAVNPMETNPNPINLHPFANEWTVNM